MSKNDVNFLSSIVDAVHKKGVVGEDIAILCLLIKICLRLVKNSDPVSSNLVLSDLSGSGKDWLVKNVCDFVVPFDCFKSYSRVSEKALNYFNIDWDAKVLHLEDIDKDFLNSSVIKTMASSGSRLLVTVGVKEGADEIIIVGKPVMLVTSYNAMVDEEGVRRWDYLRLDVTRGQSKAIVRSLVKPVVMKGIQKVLHSLASFNVVIPFEKQIVSVLPYNINMRSEKVKFLDYIRSSAVLFQKFRKVDKNGFLIAERFDYDFARFVFYCFNSSGFSSLNKQQEELFDLVKSSVENSVPVRYLISNSNLSKDSVYRYVDRLKLFGLIGVEYKFDDSANKDIMYVFVKDLYSLQYLCRLFASDFNVVLKMLDDFRVKSGLSVVFSDIMKLANFKVLKNKI